MRVVMMHQLPPTPFLVHLKSFAWKFQMDRHRAIRNVYPNARRIDDGEGAFDKNGNQIVLDESKISAEMERTPGRL